MAGPSSAPRGEHAPTPGAGWEAELRSTGEQYLPDGEPEPRANRATRRAARGRKRLGVKWDRVPEADLPFPAETASHRRPNAPPATRAKEAPPERQPYPPHRTEEMT